MRLILQVHTSPEAASAGRSTVVDAFESNWKPNMTLNAAIARFGILTRILNEELNTEAVEIAAVTAKGIPSSPRMRQRSILVNSSHLSDRHNHLPSLFLALLWSALMMPSLLDLNGTAFVLRYL